ncbi:E3 ubiquitin-protein ligase RBBP6 isoform X2 [Harmonia axyridis]|uniref:E3 ubiquitin-protein ligase RBBP6 isoform X2 n=1 Tax=Harmonia axyridis TaxID=115357 RepID=UPI001E276119|nr:E3 ubiquitin-protein ligase RBBP6 isoform X2 [Harmonia axyridis]
MPRRDERSNRVFNGDTNGPVRRSPVRKERLRKSKRELEEEAAKVLEQAGKVECVVSSNRGVPQEKFYTLPNRRKGKLDYGSLNRKSVHRSSLELQEPPKKPPRTFTSSSNDPKPSVFEIFKKTDDKKPKKPNLRRSLSDATNLRSRPALNRGENERKSNESEDTRRSKRNLPKKQLSPIIEVQQREDYFDAVKEEEEHNNEPSEDNVELKAPVRKKRKENRESVTKSLKKYIDEIDAQLYEETGIRVQHGEKETKAEPEVVIIDVDEAEQITRQKNSKTSALGKKLKSLTTRKTPVTTKNPQKKSFNEKLKLEALPNGSPNTKIKKTIKKLETSEENQTKMIHSSQKPADKPPLTKGRTVDTMVKRLSSDSSISPPPKTNILVIPNVSVQHNNNQPFSYTRGISPEKHNGQDPGSPVIYAQVVCANGATGPSKQTVHTVYNSNVKKHPQHSDSDEGLGYEEHFNRKYSPLESPLSKPYDNRYVTDVERDDYFMEADEAPISPRMKSTYFSGYPYEKGFVSVERGRADGMDSKRRESLTESLENSTNKVNGKIDWSARRDLLESRINRRMNDRITRVSPPNNSNVYITESTSKYFKKGSESPVGFTEKYVSESHTDRFGERYNTESHTKKYFGDRKDDVEYITNGRYPYEPKSMESQHSDYRSSPESRRFETSHNRSNDRYGMKAERQHRLSKEKTIYQSNPEIFKHREEPSLDNSYHDSLRRERRTHKSERYLSDRKDKFGDSGIENDIKREENYRPERRRTYGVRNTESEDEGFASSLLIASERQHTEEAVNGRKLRVDYDYDAPYEREEYEYRKRKMEYAPRERSIDDGSHYDPRIDKDFENERGTLVRKIEKKPPKPEKKSGLEKVKQLFMGSSKKKKDKQIMVAEEDLRSRYKEYRGSMEHLEPQVKKREVREYNASYDYRNRSRLPTPSPEPPKNGYINGHTNGHVSDSNTSHNGWFKSLDRLSKKKNRKDEVDGVLTSAEEEPTPKSQPTKSLRFFGDSLRQRTTTRSRTDISGKDRIKSQSTRDLHNISEETRTPQKENGIRKHNHKSMLNIAESDREMSRTLKSTLKPPASPSHRSREPQRRDDRSRRSKNEVSSLESSTEGDSSQQSQRSIVYLHAATVGDIPGPGYLRNSSRAASREELASNGSNNKMQPRVKTLSRSFSMLAPWKPRHLRESMDIDYSQYPKPVPVPKNGKYEQRVPRNGTSRNSTSSTLKKKAHETKRSTQNVSTLGNHRSRSKENMSSQTLKRNKDESTRNSTSTLYKKKERLPRENSRYSKDKDDRKISSKSASVESLGNHSRTSRGREDSREVSRSISMPRDPEKSAGWFKMGRKSSKNVTSQRL